MTLHQVLLSGRYWVSKQLEEISEIQASSFQSSSNNEDIATSKSTSFPKRINQWTPRYTPTISLGLQKQLKKYGSIIIQLQKPFQRLLPIITYVVAWHVTRDPDDMENSVDIGDPDCLRHRLIDVCTVWLTNLSNHRYAIFPFLSFGWWDTPHGIAYAIRIIVRGVTFYHTDYAAHKKNSIPSCGKQCLIPCYSKMLIPW